MANLKAWLAEKPWRASERSIRTLVTEEDAKRAAQRIKKANCKEIYVVQNPNTTALQIADIIMEKVKDVYLRFRLESRIESANGGQPRGGWPVGARINIPGPMQQRSGVDGLLISKGHHHELGDNNSVYLVPEKFEAATRQPQLRVPKSPLQVATRAQQLKRFQDARMPVLMAKLQQFYSIYDKKKLSKCEGQARLFYWREEVLKEQLSRVYGASF